MIITSIITSTIANITNIMDQRVQNHLMIKEMIKIIIKIVKPTTTAQTILVNYHLIIH